MMVLAVGASTAFVVVAVLFANITAASRVADNARNLHWANSTLGTAALARAAAGQVGAFAELADTGLVSPRAIALARSELEETTEALQSMADEAPATASTDLTHLLALLGESPVDTDAVDAAYRSVADELADRVASLEEEIAASERTAGYVSGVVRLMVTLILPATAILLYRHRARDQVRAAAMRMEALLEAEREVAKAKDAFVAGMSHEMRTPLTGIYGFSEILLESSPEDHHDRELVIAINTEAAELSRMVDDFIAASRIDGPGLEVDLQPTDLAALSEMVAQQFRRRGAAIQVTGQADPAMCDGGRTRQILTNLVSNAVRHGGATIEIILERDDDVVLCSVVDDGEGVEPDLEERLFSRFAHEGRAVLTEGSLGLGTWVARTFAQAMGGDLTYQRRHGRTFFTLSLPPAETSEISSAQEGYTMTAAR